MLFVRQNVEQVRGAGAVDIHVFADLKHALANTDHGGLVEDSFGAFDRAFQGFVIADIAGQEARLRVQVFGNAAVVNLRFKVIENGDVVAALDQRVDDEAADEPRAAGN